MRVFTIFLLFFLTACLTACQNGVAPPHGGIGDCERRERCYPETLPDGDVDWRCEIEVICPDTQPITFNKKSAHALLQSGQWNSMTLSQAAKALETEETALEEFILKRQKALLNQAKSSDSTLWQSCFAHGAWTTPENDFCQKRHWRGCSPETGASFCFVHAPKINLNVSPHQQAY